MNIIIFCFFNLTIKQSNPDFLRCTLVKEFDLVKKSFIKHIPRILELFNTIISKYYFIILNKTLCYYRIHAL